MVDLELKRRLLDLSFNNKVSHLGSYFSSLGILDEIYAKMEDDDIFILPSGS